jgi:hypothetical protein
MGSIAWKETPRTGPLAEAKIRAIEIEGFYQQPGLGIPAIFCRQCGTMKTIEG